MNSKKLVILLVSVILGVAWHLSGSKDESFYYYYPGGFGDGELSNIMDIFYQNAPETNTAMWRMRPVFVFNDTVEGKVSSSYDLLSNKTKQDIGFENETQILNFVSEKFPGMRWKSYVVRTRNDGEAFTLIVITNRTDSDLKITVYHELYHFLDLYTEMFDFNGKKQDFHKKMESKLTDYYGTAIGNFKESYDIRYNEQMAFLSSAYMDSTSINPDSVQSSYFKVVKEDIRIEKLESKVPALSRDYKQYAIRGFFADLIKSETRVDECDFSCLAEMYLSDQKVLDLEFKYLVENDYFNMKAKNPPVQSSGKSLKSSATL